MSYLRRRMYGLPSDSSRRTPSPAQPNPRAPPSQDGSSSEEPDSVRIPIAKLEQLNAHLKKPRKGNKRRNAWIFGLGGLFGILIALFFAGSNDMIDLAALKDMNLDSLMEALPAGLINDAQELQVGSTLSTLLDVCLPGNLEGLRDVAIRNMSAMPWHTTLSRSGCTLVV